MEISINGKSYPLEFGMHALTATMKENGIHASDFESLYDTISDDPVKLGESLIYNGLVNTARKYRKELDITREDVWILIDSPEFLFEEYPKLLKELLESMSVGDHAKELLKAQEGDSAPKKKKTTPN